MTRYCCIYAQNHVTQRHPRCHSVTLCDALTSIDAAPLYDSFYYPARGMQADNTDACRWAQAEGPKAPRAEGPKAPADRTATATEYLR